MSTNITAKNLDDFNKIETLLNKLPKKIRDQIEGARIDVVGLHCLLSDTYSDKKVILLPNSVRQISDFGDYIGIYCGDYFFKIEGDFYNRKHNYSFIECEDLS